MLGNLHIFRITKQVTQITDTLFYTTITDTLTSYQPVGENMYPIDLQNYFPIVTAILLKALCLITLRLLASGNLYSSITHY